MYTRLLYAAALAAPVLAVPGWAQSLPATNIDDRFRSQQVPQTEDERTEAILTGDTDLLLLRPTPLFTVSGSLALNPTSNAFLSGTDTRSDLVFQTQAGLRLGTRIGGRVDVFAEGGVVAVRYDRFAELSYGAFTGAVGIGTSVAGFDATLTYQPSIITSRDFGTRQLTQHQFAGSLSRTFAFKRLRITPSISGSRVEASPGDYRNWSYGGELGITHPLRIGTMRGFAYASAGHEWRSYDAYFPDLLGGDRNDRLIRASAGIALPVTALAGIRAGYSFQRNRSSSDVNGYRAHSGAFSLALATRF